MNLLFNLLIFLLSCTPKTANNTANINTSVQTFQTINGNLATRNPAYYILAHAAKFVRPGSVRINSSLPGNLPNVAFQTPEGYYFNNQLSKENNWVFTRQV